MVKPTSKRTGRDSDQFLIRLPAGMRKQLMKAAEHDGRSMNALIVTALAAYLESLGTEESNQRTRAMMDLLIRLDEKLAELVKKPDTDDGLKQKKGV